MSFVSIRTLQTNSNEDMPFFFVLFLNAMWKAISRENFSLSNIFLAHIAILPLYIGKILVTVFIALKTVVELN